MHLWRRGFNDGSSDVLGSLSARSEVGGRFLFERAKELEISDWHFQRGQRHISGYTTAITLFSTASTTSSTSPAQFLVSVPLISLKPHLPEIPPLMA